MAEHGRGTGGRHATPGEARPASGTTATVGAAPAEVASAGPARAQAEPTAPFASAGAPPRRAAHAGGGRAAGPDDGRVTGPAVGTPEPDELDEFDDDTDLDLGAPVRGVGWVLLIGGLVGAVVALVLTIEKLDLLANPDYIPSCSIDPVLSCGTIMKTWQASLLGFPNPVIGLLTFPVVAACGAVVVSGAELPRWVWLALEAGSFAGVLFIHWLIVQSLVTIHALCPYCMVAWVAVIAIFWFTTVHNLREGNLGGAPAGETLARRHGWGLAAWYLLIVVAVVASFPAYFGAMVGLG
ncbi:MAG TPA: vitamin K epoxide reductase family protein [Actinomycetospora sp.]|uniref:vitamin K epoxide reductase family protein n=1 Tax=Actinomycetospora sp. TaxID=1872135 RepID=UPI002F3F23D2